jgi:hypothetical protein
MGHRDEWHREDGACDVDGERCAADESVHERDERRLERPVRHVEVAMRNLTEPDPMRCVEKVEDIVSETCLDHCT